MKSTLTTLALALAACAAQAGTFDAWTLTGSAQLLDGGDTLRLAEGNYQAGSAWLSDKVSLAHDFSVSFSFKIAGGSGADGFTFTVRDSEAGTGALGNNGGGLGYEGIGNSAAFVFDTWENGQDTDRVEGPNTAPTYNGSLSPWGQTVGHAYALRDAVLHAWVDYSAASKTYSLYLADTDVKPLTAQETLDGSLAALGGGAYIGFTGGTGGATDNHDILGVTVAAVPVPEADTALLALAGLPLALAFIRRQRRAA